MRTQYITIKEIKTPIKLNTFLYLYDICFIGVYWAITSRMNFIVHPILRIPYYIMCALWGIYFTLPSPYNPQKRNWESIIYCIFRNRYNYGECESMLEKKVRGE